MGKAYFYTENIYSRMKYVFFFNYETLKVESQNFLDPVLVLKPSFWGSFEKLRLGFKLLMFYNVEPSSVF